MSSDNGSSLIVERCSVVLLVFSPLALPAEGCIIHGNARSYVMFLFFHEACNEVFMHHTKCFAH